MTTPLSSLCLVMKYTRTEGVKSVPDQLVVVQEGCVFDQAEALLHSVDERLDL